MMSLVNVQRKVIVQVNVFNQIHHALRITPLYCPGWLRPDEKPKGGGGGF